MQKITFILFVFLSSCMTSKEISKTNIETIQFGSGGGFTGAVKSYTLSANGEIKENDSLIKKINSKETLQLFKIAEGLKDYHFNEPENIYSFIEIKTKNNRNNIVWHLGSEGLDSNAVKLYNKLLLEIK